MDALYPSLALPQLMIINQRTQQGIFGNANNTFQLSIEKNDTLTIYASGYNPVKICFKDSLPASDYYPLIKLSKQIIQLKEVAIFQKRDLNSIENDIKKLGYDPRKYKVTGITAWQSPITAMYEAFSKKAQSKRKVAELMNTDDRNALLKDLLYNYYLSGLISLPREQYDDFISYLNMTDRMMQSMSQYEMAVYIKARYFSFMHLYEIH